MGMETGHTLYVIKCYTVRIIIYYRWVWNAQNFVEKTFTGVSQTAKFVKVFFVESFLLLPYTCTVCSYVYLDLGSPAMRFPNSPKMEPGGPEQNKTNKQ